MFNKYAPLFAMALFFLPHAQADLIDFEGFAPATTVGPVVTATNTVTFAVGNVAPSGPATVVGVGAPVESFFSNDAPVGGSPGLRFLSDSPAGPGDGVALNYFLVFAAPISDISIDVYDFGDAAVGSTMTLTTFSDPTFTTVVTSTTVAGSLLDGSVIPISAIGGPASSATLVFNATDAGVGIDNVSFNSSAIPEPMTITMFGAGILALGWIRRRRQRQA